jgi:hypothetical protein
VKRYLVFGEKLPFKLLYIATTIERRCENSTKVFYSGIRACSSVVVGFEGNL